MSPNQPASGGARTLTVPGPNGTRAYVYVWLPEGRARAAVQIIHGMAEHAGRYARLARHLNAAGYAVYAQDLPGHGRSVRGPEELGHVADTGGWSLMLASINMVRRHLDEELQQMPVFALGHSMGSFLLQHLVRDPGAALAGAIFSATSGDLGALRAVGHKLLQMEALWSGRRHRSALGERLSFRDFNRRFRPNRTGFDWLSRDHAEVDRYLRDPRCGFRVSCGLWLDLLEACAGLDAVQGVPVDLPVLLIAGSRDPVTRGKQGPESLARHYRRAGLKDVETRIYPDARHELFNDTCREQVTADLIQWLDDHVFQMNRG
ncbi:MAG: alpha/beta fold hydrolase [Gammaproteobacteria bacterium]|jgi:alpha-beta hydrolase superfamily lysophospholipase